MKLSRHRNLQVHVQICIRIQITKSEGPRGRNLEYEHRVWKRDIVSVANDGCFLFSFARDARCESGKCEAGQSKCEI